jgi:hypothetical protein
MFLVRSRNIYFSKKKHWILSRDPVPLTEEENLGHLRRVKALFQIFWSYWAVNLPFFFSLVRTSWYMLKS